MPSNSTLRRLLVPDLVIRGERAFRPIAVYPALKRMLIEDGVAFRSPEPGSRHAHRDRILFLNLTFYAQGADGSDLLEDDSLDVDVLAHAAWHHAARKALITATSPTAAAMFLGESVASAFDLYVIGRMLQTGRGNAYLSSQLPALSAAAEGAGLDEEALGALLTSVAEDPDGAFEELRELLFDASLALLACADADAAIAALDALSSNRFSCLLHHYEVSNWVLYARAYAGPAVADDPALVMDRAVRAAPVALDWLEANWLTG